ncbi:MAG: hypothetical protein IM569_13530, partial [Chitinophagaceae bacterium]|nr:hypothetical protein [Chitinophagaceae bacterium]
THVLQTATYSVTPRTLAANCTGSAFTVVVSVTPTPEFVTLSTVTCSGVQFQVSPAVGVGGGNIVPSNTLYTWTEPSFTGTVTGGQSSQGIARTHIFGTLSNRTNSQQTVIYSVTPRTGNCTGSVFSVVVTLNPTPEFVTLTTVTCSGVQFQVSPVVGVGGGNIVPLNTLYKWDAPSYTGTVTGGQSSQNLFVSHVSGTLSNRTNTQQTVTYSVTPQTGNCTGSVFSVVVTLNPTPEFVTLTTVTCSGVQFQVSPAVGVGGGNIVPLNTLYKWDAPSYTGTVTGGQSSQNLFVSHVSGTLSNRTNTQQTVTYSVTPQTGNCFGSVFSVVVTLDPKPEFVTLSTVICSGVEFQVSPVVGTYSGNIVPANTTYTWGEPGYSASLSGGISGSNQSFIRSTIINASNTTQTATYTVIPTTGNCTGSSFTLIVTVHPVPKIASLSTVTCSGTPFEVSPTNVHPDIVPSNTRYRWSVPTYTASLNGGESATDQPSITGLLFNTSSVEQRAFYTVTPSTINCNVSNSFTVTVHVRAGGYIDPMSSVVCSGVQFNVVPQDGVNGIVPNGISYSWNVPNYTLSVSGGQSDTGQLSIFGTLTNNTNVIQTATYLVTPTPLNCGPNSNFTLTVTILPAAYINPITVPVCNGVVFGFTPTDGATYGIVPAETLYSWSTPAITASITGGGSATNRSGFFGQLFNSSNATQTATYTVTTKTGTCIGQPFTVQVVVNPPMIISAMSTVVCSRSMFTVLPQNGVNGTVPDNTLYSWSEPTFNTFLTGGQSGSNSKPITGTLFNTSNIPQTTVYTITPTSGVCTGANFTLTVTVNPTPEFSTLSTVTCSGVEFQVSPAAGFVGNIVPSDTRYTWEAPSVTGTLTGGQSSQGIERTHIFGTLSN